MSALKTNNNNLFQQLLLLLCFYVSISFHDDDDDDDEMKYIIYLIFKKCVLGFVLLCYDCLIKVLIFYCIISSLHPDCIWLYNYIYCYVMSCEWWLVVLLLLLLLPIAKPNKTKSMNIKWNIKFASNYMHRRHSSSNRLFYFCVARSVWFD